MVPVAGWALSPPIPLVNHPDDHLVAAEAPRLMQHMLVFVHVLLVLSLLELVIHQLLLDSWNDNDCTCNCYEKLGRYVEGDIYYNNAAIYPSSDLRNLFMHKFALCRSPCKI